MNQYTKRKLDEAMSFTQNDINKMPTDKLYDYVKVMVKEANRRRKVMIESDEMTNNPLRDKIIEKGKYILPEKNEKFMRQKLISEFSKTYNLLSSQLSTIKGWKQIRSDTRKRFIERFKSEPDSDTGELSKEAKKRNQKLMFISHSKLNDFWKLYDKLLEDPEVYSYVQGLDTNTFLQDVYELADSYNFTDLDNKVNKAKERLVGKGNGILREQYFKKQDDN